MLRWLKSGCEVLDDVKVAFENSFYPGTFEEKDVKVA